MNTIWYNIKRGFGLSWGYFLAQASRTVLAVIALAIIWMVMKFVNH